MTSVCSSALASIHYQYVTVDVSGCVRSQKDRGAFKIFFGTEAARRNVAEQMVSLVLNDFARHVRGKPSRSNGIDLDIMPRPFHRKIARE